MKDHRSSHRGTMSSRWSYNLAHYFILKITMANTTNSNTTSHYISRWNNAWRNKPNGFWLYIGKEFKISHALCFPVSQKAIKENRTYLIFPKGKELNVAPVCYKTWEVTNDTKVIFRKLTYSTAKKLNQTMAIFLVPLQMKRQPTGLFYHKP